MIEVEDVENVEMYNYSGAPVSVEKKIVVAEVISLKSATGGFEYSTSADIIAYWSNLDSRILGNSKKSGGVALLPKWN